MTRPLAYLTGSTIAAGLLIAANRRQKNGIGRYFIRADVVRSNLAVQNDLMAAQNSITPGQLLNAERLALFVIDPAADFLGDPPEVTSWYRSPELNAIVPGASSTSVHKTGRAADLVYFFQGAIRNDLLARAILQRSQFDRLILERGTTSRPQWLHVEVAPFGQSPRRKILYTPDGVQFAYITITEAMQLFA